MTRVVLINAGPTQWDQEDRLTGNHNLPLADDARDQIEALVHTLPPIDAVYCPSDNEACYDTANRIAIRFDLRVREKDELAAMNLGLWQGLRREDVRRRFPTVFEQWEENPANVIPPEGESVEDAIARLRDVMKRILRRNRGKTIAIALRPRAMQIVAGILRLEEHAGISSHLLNSSPIETIELADEQIKQV
jgi:broad specificity phosphatase PhoE